MPLNLPKDLRITPAVFGVIDAHGYEIMDVHWPSSFRPIVAWEETTLGENVFFDISVGHYFLHRNGNGINKRKSSDMYPDAFCMTVGRNKLEELEHQALKFIAMQYWDVIADTWTPMPPMTPELRTEALRSWETSRDGQIRVKTAQLAAYIQRMESERST